MNIRPDSDVVILFALHSLKGIGAHTVLRVAKAVPSLKALPSLAESELQQYVGNAQGSLLHQFFHQTPGVWKRVLEEAAVQLQRHLDQDIIPLALTSPRYPPLLKLIPDPPPILYVKGNVGVLRQYNAVAIVGTREPTRQGTFIARQMAARLAEQQWSIVSGLAKGIDAAAHQGALSVQGITIAVLATSLDIVYPAEHRGLAEHILASNGVLVSELALGQRSFRSDFVRRDRIQSGLSLAVFPIQTSATGGTMHTVNFAREQKRLIICPQPSPREAHRAQYEGIQQLLSEQNDEIKRFTISRVDNQELLAWVQQKRNDLLQEEPSLHPKSAQPNSPLSSPPASLDRASPVQPQDSAKRVHTLAHQKNCQDEAFHQHLITGLLSDIQPRPVADHSEVQSLLPASSLIQMEIFTGDVEYGVLPADVLCSVPMPTVTHDEKRPRKRRLKQAETKPLDWDEA